MADPMAFGEAYAQRRTEAGEREEDLARWFTAAIRNDDEAALRAFVQRDGFAYALTAKGDQAESIVLNAALAGKLSIRLMEVFFRELGGRYIVELEEGLTVWGTLLRVDAWLLQIGPNQDINRGNAQYLVQLYRRMEEVVACLMETLRFPLGPFPGLAAPRGRHVQRNTLRVTQVMRVALENFQAFNSVLALGQRLLTPEAYAHEVSEVWAPYMLTTISDVEALQSEAHAAWLREVLLPRVSTEVVLRFRANERLRPMVLHALADEADRRANATTRHMASLLHFQPRNTSAERVMQAPELSDLIHRLSWTDDNPSTAILRASRAPDDALWDQWRNQSVQRTLN